MMTSNSFSVQAPLVCLAGRISPTRNWWSGNLELLKEVVVERPTSSEPA